MSNIPISLLPRTWAEALKQDYINLATLDDLAQFEPLTGTQTPDGNVTSNRSQVYYRIDGGTKETYFNPAVNANTGWVLMP